jgi:hypothetical protein
MRVPLYLAVAQWTVLFAFGLLVIIMYRQLWRVFSPSVPGQHGPEVSSKAESFEYRRISDGTLQYVTPGAGKALLLAFVNPTCLSCEKLVESMSAAHDLSELDDLRVLLLTSEPAKFLDISAPFRNTRLEIGLIATRATLSAYAVTATPLVVAVDSSGVVRAAGPAQEIAEVRNFARAGLAAPELELATVTANATTSEEERPNITAARESERSS